MRLPWPSRIRVSGNKTAYIGYKSMLEWSINRLHFYLKFSSSTLLIFLAILSGGAEASRRLARNRPVVDGARQREALRATPPEIVADKNRIPEGCQRRASWHSGIRVFDALGLRMH
jgi:hypothetical protein